MNAVAFGNLNPFGARLNAIFSSDVGHFDVPDMRMVLPEAYELVEDGLITADDFRDFTFANAVRLWGTQNPDFFKGTAIARQAAEVLGPATPRRAPRRNNAGLAYSALRRVGHRSVRRRCLRMRRAVTWTVAVTR